MHDYWLFTLKKHSSQPEIKLQICQPKLAEKYGYLKIELRF